MFVIVETVFVEVAELGRMRDPAVLVVDLQGACKVQQPERRVSGRKTRPSAIPDFQLCGPKAVMDQRQPRWPGSDRKPASVAERREIQHVSGSLARWNRDEYNRWAGYHAQPFRCFGSPAGGPPYRYTRTVAVARCRGAVTARRVGRGVGPGPPAGGPPANRPVKHVPERNMYAAQGSSALAATARL